MNYQNICLFGVLSLLLNSSLLLLAPITPTSNRTDGATYKETTSTNVESDQEPELVSNAQDKQNSTEKDDDPTVPPNSSPASSV